MTPIEAIADRELGIEIYLSHPSLFVTQNLSNILPEWSAQTAWVILILQQSQFALNQLHSEVEIEKNRLRNQFMNFSLAVVKALGERDFCSDIFDPMTGDPVLSRRGSMTHDDVAVVKALLNFPTTDDRCSALIHPRWQTAVYPGVLITSATPTTIEPILRQREFDEFKTSPQPFCYQERGKNILNLSLTS